MSRPPVVITGFGAVSPLGLTAEQLWENITQGNSGIDTITAFDASGFPCRIAGQVSAYKIRDYVPKTYRKATKLMSRDIELSIIASNQAIDSAGLVTKYTGSDNVTIEPARTAINFGAGLISCELEELASAVRNSITDGKFDIGKWGQDGLPAITPLWLLKYLPNMLACHVGIIHDIQGPSNTITCGEASSHIAIIEAAGVIKRGTADAAIAGGGEAKVNPVVHARQCLLKRAAVDDTANDNPKQACRPFDVNAKGSVFGEAAAALVLESQEIARGRNAKIYAVIAGSGISNSLNNPIYHLEQDGRAITIAIEKAMAQAGIGPDDIDLIIPHGTAIACDDAAEAAGITAALGSACKRIPTLPTKSMLSNTGAASGSLDIIVALKAMDSSLIPSAVNFDKPADSCNLNINTEPLQKEINYVLCTSYTFGGQTAAIILKKYNG